MSPSRNFMVPSKSFIDSENSIWTSTNSQFQYPLKFHIYGGYKNAQIQQETQKCQEDQRSFLKIARLQEKIILLPNNIWIHLLLWTQLPTKFNLQPNQILISHQFHLPFFYSKFKSPENVSQLSSTSLTTLFPKSYAQEVNFKKTLCCQILSCHPQGVSPFEKIGKKIKKKSQTFGKFALPLFFSRMMLNDR